MRARLAQRLRAEDGIALIAAIGVLAVLTILCVGAVGYSSSNSRSASISSSGNEAAAMAEAGVNEAMAVLSNPANDALDGALLPTTTTQYENGSVTWSGTYDPQLMNWRIVATATTPNPTGAAPLQKTLRATSQIVGDLSQPLNNMAWNYLYARRTGDPDGCDMTLQNSIQLAASLYVEGNLCLENSASIVRATAPPTPVPAVNLVVKGSVTFRNSSFIGTNAARINQALIAGGCDGNVPCRWNGGGDPVWATTVGTVPTQITPPTADFAYWYENASPGPKHPCVTQTGTPPVFENETVNPTRNNSVPTVNLLPANGYSCVTPLGELSWNPATRKLTVRGVVYIDGAVVTTNSSASYYEGMASLYLSGSFTMANSTLLCATSTTCSYGSWNPNDDMLMVAAAGTTGYSVVFENSSRFQGGVWAAGVVQVQNSVDQDGPMIADTFDLVNSVNARPFLVIDEVPPGTPGQPNIYAHPEPPRYG